MTSVSSNIQEILTFRESLYRFFSECLLRPPSGSVAVAWRDAEWRGAFARLLDLLPSALPSVAELDDGKALAVEHARLFLLPATQTCPFQSYHEVTQAAAQDEGFRASPAGTAAAVQRVYRSWGLCPEEQTEEVSDHAATELRFMAMLVAIEGRVRANGAGGPLCAVLSAEADFLDQHILNWFPAWTALVQARARLPFYPALVHLLMRFLEMDRHTLELFIGSDP